MPGIKEVTRLHRTSFAASTTSEERERALNPILPKPREGNGTHPSKPLQGPAAGVSSKSNPAGRWRRPRLRPMLARLLHQLLFQLMQILFSIYIHARQSYHAITSQIFTILYYHHRSPELIQKDVKGLSRLPQHLSIIVDLKDSGRSTRRASGQEGLEKLMSDVAEVAAWCVCVGIPMLSVYEQTGILKSHQPSLHHTLCNHLASYFASSASPTLHIRAPHHPAYSPPSTSPPPPMHDDGNHDPKQRPHLNLLLLSASDGRATLVDLTKTLAEMSQRGKLSPTDISADLIEAEVADSSCGEPDLLVLMAPSAYKARTSTKRRSRSRRGSKERRGSGSWDESDDEDVGAVGAAGGDVCLRGYPPWQVRLTEIFHVQDCMGVEYQAFLRALHRYAKAEMRFGR